jgi:hypothetical protein
MLTNVIRHPLTSIAGILTGGTLFAVVQAGCGTMSWKAWLVAVLPTLLGLAAKDPGSKPLK